VIENMMSTFNEEMNRRQDQMLAAPHRDRLDGREGGSDRREISSNVLQMLLICDGGKAEQRKRPDPASDQQKAPDDAGA
jgi:hypothetical protein